MAEQQAILAGGCFWCTEAVFKDVIGVSAVESGYIGGHVDNPTYKEVCGGDYRPCRGDPGDLRSRADFAMTTCSTSSSRPTIRPSSTARATTSARNIARRSSRWTRAGGGGAARRSNAPQADWPAPIVTTIEPLGDLVAGRGLSPGLLGERGAAQPLLPRGHPAQAAETAQELPGPAQGGRNRLERRGGAAQPVVDRGAEAGRPGSARRRSARLALASASCSASNRLAAASTRSPEALSVASPATAPKPISHSSGAAVDRVEPERLAGRIMARRAGPAPRSRRRSAASRPRSIGPGRSRRGAAAGQRDDRRFQAVRGRPAIDDQRDPAAEARPATCAARVGLIRPLALADGAASGRPAAASSARIAGCAGHADRDRRQARRDQRRRSRRPSRSGRTRVSGPGQKRSASARACVVEHRDLARPARDPGHGRSAD